ncbi:MAG: T9SS type A sorting domain-containing protein [bacterium]
MYFRRSITGLLFLMVFCLHGPKADAGTNLIVLRWSGSHGLPPGQPHNADIFHSTDNGQTWERKGTVLDEYPYDDMGLDIASSPSRVLYCILWDRDHVATVFRSFDEGLSWGAAGVVRNDYSHWDAVSAALACPSEDLIYALLWSKDVTNGCEVYVSSDSGTTWTLKSAFAGGLAGQDKDIGFAVGASDALYALIWNANDYPRVYKSIDGINWSELGIVDYMMGSEAYCGASLVSIGGSSELISGGADTLVAGFWSGPAHQSLPLLSYHSTDGGMSWEVGDTVVQAVVDDGAFCFGGDMNGNVYAVAWTNYFKASCYRSSDLGRSWVYKGQIFPTFPYAWTAGIAITTYSTAEGAGRLQVDIRPTSCPNPLSTKSQGVLPAAILGTKDFDVTDINVSAVRLEGVGPIRISVEDVATPVSESRQAPPVTLVSGAEPDMADVDVMGVAREHPVHVGEYTGYSSVEVSGLEDPCECTTDGPDGFDDLTLKFRTQEIVAALGEVSDRDTLMLTLTAELMDGSELEGGDCVVILRKRRAAKRGAQGHGLQSIRVNSATPAVSALFQNHPNPFGQRTSIKYAVAAAGPVNIGVYDHAGVLLKTLVNSHRAPGVYTVAWEEMDLPSGVYFCRLEAGEFASTRKMVSVR